MAVEALSAVSRARSNSGSTLKQPSINEESLENPSIASEVRQSIQTSLSTHNETFSLEQVLFAESCLSGTNIRDGDLVEITQLRDATAVRDFETQALPSDAGASNAARDGSQTEKTNHAFICKVKIATPEQSAKQQNLAVSLQKAVATKFGLTSPSLILVTKADVEEWIASHIEICFRDAYLSRSDMWRFACQELVGKTAYVGQKISFLNSLKATVRGIHVQGRRSQIAYFGNTTVPVFRSEAARYVIFIQMSREMWDFDSEGNGEILFNKVVNGFLPDLFKRWSDMEVRHLVSIVMFGRLEYKQSDMNDGNMMSNITRTMGNNGGETINHQDFYRVVVTDMASAQWATILEELKRDFRVFLRDVSLFRRPEGRGNNSVREEIGPEQNRITGRLSGALKGNILEAINLAASQFSNDYIDRDLIRTGISTVVVTAGSGVFDVDRDLLRLTSETLTNNGVGIDIVCLSRMPLHSVPLFRYRLKDNPGIGTTESSLSTSIGSNSLSTTLPHPSLPDLSGSPAFSSANASLKYFSRFPSAFPSRLPQIYGYGIPQWIDLSYWSSDADLEKQRLRRKRAKTAKTSTEPFLPRVRMYELQMMGLMELGMADISIPYLSQKSGKGDLNFRRWAHEKRVSSYARSLSRSPELRKKSPVAAMRQQKGPANKHEGVSVISRMLAAMDDYDASLFAAARIVTQERSKPPRDAVHDGRRMQELASLARPISIASKSSFKNPRVAPDSDEKSETASIRSSITKPVRPARAPRNFSYSARGLLPFKASAVASIVSTEHVKAQTQPLAVQEHVTGNTTSDNASIRSSASHTQANNNVDSGSRPSTGTKHEESSMPIRIAPAGNDTSLRINAFSKQTWQQLRQHRNQSDTGGNLHHSNASDSDGDSIHASITPSSVPDSKIPFLRNVNASNPLKRRSYADVFGRWQHLYPRKPRSATVKWRSLCTPASVPLTTEDFPSREDLDLNYEGICHSVPVSDSSTSTIHHPGSGHALLLEMISLRIAHGYQFVVGETVSSVLGKKLDDCYNLCDTENDKTREQTVVLAMGNTIQKLELSGSSVKVTKHIQKLTEADMLMSSTIGYTPFIRTILSNGYFPRELAMKGFSEQYPWNIADSALANINEQDSDNIVKLRHWRARYVLLPVEPPVATWKKHQADENEEEIHLLGIRALTQLWQRHQFRTAEEKALLHSRASTLKRHDENPLEVKMETVNMSELVAMELDRLVQVEDGVQLDSVPLVPEPQRLDRSSGMTKIAQAMQGESGIEIKNRRWHLKLYYNCFHGEEFTNWLMRNVQNMPTRDEAVEFGNQLMKEGLFEHVNGRHGFKDGTYFYSIRQPYRTSRMETPKSWFLHGRQSERSVPATPATEHASRELLPNNVRTRSGSNIAQQLHSGNNSENKLGFERKRKAVSLSRMIRVDVDPKKRSFLSRPEFVDVHYDRFHNPENCYHLELNWISTTCKLVDDAVSSWTIAAERYGLKLVEVPLAEACEVPKTEPFRNPYRIKLALEPPKHKAPGILFNPVFYSTNSFSPQSPAAASNIDKHVFQKAILRRSNFVLDMEAIHEFPENVRIDYNGGKLEYKHTQFVHRSGVILAQIMDDGDIILLANRLYNSRLVNTKEASVRFAESRRDYGPQAHRPAVPPSSLASMQASGIIGVNLASPTTGVNSSPALSAVPNLGLIDSPSFTPLDSSINGSAMLTSSGLKSVMADTFGPKSKFASTGLWNTLITPEQIKDDLEAFCLDKFRLEAFYKEVLNAPAPSLSGPANGSRKTTGGSSSSLMRPMRDIPLTMASDITGMPAFDLGEPLTAVRQLRRATVAYDNSFDMYDRSKIGSRNGSVGSNGNGNGNGNGSGNGNNDREFSERSTLPMSPLGKAAK